jgi:hypothetical protein
MARQTRWVDTAEFKDSSQPGPAGTAGARREGDIGPFSAVRSPEIQFRKAAIDEAGRRVLNDHHYASEATYYRTTGCSANLFGALLPTR